jgi:hypothetical protein
MVKTPEEAEQKSIAELPKRTHSKRTFKNRPDGGSLNRARKKEMEKEKGAKFCMQMLSTILSKIQELKIVHKN